MEEIIDYVDKWKKNEGSWIQELYYQLAHHNFCNPILSYNLSDCYITIIGKKYNVDFVKYLADQLVARIRPMGPSEWLKVKAFVDSKKNTYIRSFYRGVVTGIGIKLSENIKVMMEDKSNLPAIINKNTLMIKDYVKEEHPNLSKKSSTSISDGGGFETGLEKGKSMNIHKGVTGNSNPSGNRLLG